MAGESARKMSERLARRAERYRRGAEGEEATGEALTGLVPTSWVVIHDVAWPGRKLANIDHVVIGPSGVFVIDSKNWSGQITVEGGVLRQEGRARVSTMRSAEAARTAVAALVPAEISEHVHAVLCFSDEAPDASTDGVLICSTSTLLTLVTSRPRALTDESVRTVAASLRSLLPSATEPRPAPLIRRPKPRVRKRGSDRRTVLSAVAGLAMAVILLLNPGPVIALTNGISDLLSDQMQPPENDPVQPTDKTVDKKHKAPAKQKDRPGSTR